MRHQRFVTGIRNLFVTRVRLLVLGSLLLSISSAIGQLLTPGAEHRVGGFSTEQRFPSIAIGRSVDLVVWLEADKAAGPERVIGRRLNRDGEPVDGEPMLISAGLSSSAFPCVAFDGNAFLVVWIVGGDWGRLVGRRISEDGNFLDSNPFLIAGQWASSPAVVFGADEYLVAWSSFDNVHSSIAGIFAVRVSRAGIVLDSVPQTIFDSPWDDLQPMVVYGRGRFAVTWYTLRWMGTHLPTFTPWLAFLSGDATVTAEVTVQELMSVAGDYARLGWNGSEFLAATQVDDTVYAVRLSSSGVATKPVVIDKRAVPGYLHGVANVGSTWIVLLEQNNYAKPSRSTGLYLSPESLRTDLAFPIGVDAVGASVASEGEHAAVVYVRSDDGFSTGPRAVFLRTLSELAIPTGRRRAAHP